VVWWEGEHKELQDWAGVVKCSCLPGPGLGRMGWILVCAHNWLLIFMLSKFLGDYRQRSNEVVPLTGVRGWYGVAQMRAWELFSSTARVSRVWSPCGVRDRHVH